MAGRGFIDIDRAQSAAAIWHVPLVDLDRFLGLDLPYWRDIVSHESFDQFWQKVSIREKYRGINIPALNVGGWHSPWELRGTLTHFREMVLGRSDEVRKRQKLVIGPWTHNVNQNRQVGDFDFGPEAIIDLQQLQLRWYDRWLKEEANGIESEPPVSIFVMGANAWRSEETWPLERAIPKVLYLRSGGRANSRFGDGRLSTEPPPDNEPPDRFRYDPERPVPSMISETGDDESLYSDQRPIERRDDVLVYRTAPVETDLELTGPVSVTLFASTSARDTDFTAMLLDVHPDGYAKPLTWGIARGRYLKSYSEPTLLEPGETYEWTVDLWATSNVFKAGHRIQLDLSSSYFPFFGRNHNTGNPAATDTEFVVAEQTIHHSAEYRSQLVLQVVREAGRTQIEK
jgi:putative CocE/NonD family hydrolase